MNENLGNGLRIFPVGWHVDYWDYLGHPDPYATEAFTERQRSYAQAMSSTTIFTPHILVNGQTIQPVSSGSVGGAISAALEATPVASVTLWQDPEDAGTGAVVHFKTQGAPPTAELHVVAVERGIVSETIPAGENAGKVLTHDAAVRWHHIAPPDRGFVKIAVPDGTPVENLRVVAFLQSPTTMQLHGGAWLETLSL